MTHSKGKRKTNIGRAVVGGMVGTALMAVVTGRLSSALNADSIDHADFLARLTHTGKTVGELEHYTFGGVLMPLAYWKLAPYLPGPRLLRGLGWGGLLWIAAEASLSPAAGKGIFDLRAATPKKTALASLAGHLAYGLAEALIAA